MAAVILLAGIGWLLGMLVGWLLLAPAAPKPQTLHMRVAASQDHVLIGVRTGTEVHFIQIKR